MATAQAMEEELQQSVLRSEGADWDVDDDLGYGGNAAATLGNANGTIFITQTDKYQDQSIADDDDDALSDRDASGEEVEEDAEGEEDFDMLPGLQDSIMAQSHNNDVDEEEEEHDDEEDEDAEGEEDDVGIIGAVKIQLKGADDELEDDDSDVSEAPSAIEEADDSEEEEEEEEEGAWEDARDMVEDDEDSDAVPHNVCMFCKQDEEHDPSEDFEAFLTCTGCGENAAHQQCARDMAAMSERNHAKKWKCSDCYSEEYEADDNEDDAMDDARPSSQHSDIPRMARDLLAVPMGSDDGDAHSVFSELVLQDDPMDGSRLLRKRKTSSIEPDDAIMLMRKRRRQPSAGTAHDEDAAESAAISETGGPRSSRAARLKAPPPPPVTVERSSRFSLVVKINVKPGNLKEVLARKKRVRREAGGAASRPPKRVNNTPARASVAPIPAVIETPFTADSYSQPFYSFFDRDADDANGKPYGGILTDNEADTSKTLPAVDDRRRFDQAKQKAEDEWRARILAIQAGPEAPSRKPKKISDHASQIECIEFGGWEIDTWYAAPYPAEYSRNRVLYICEFCLKYMNSDYVAWRHKLKCATKHPPGDEIYRDGSISMFEVDGRKNPVYCQNLCLLAKLFLGSKTLYYDVEPFLFYVLCEYDECGYHFVGYFSKEKRSSSQNNVSCILTLPIHQRKGYGNLLIDFSYLLTRVEGKTGSPEKPLSDMGLVSYRNYWRLIICQTFIKALTASDYKNDGLSIDQISKQTGLTQDDVISALEGLRALVRDPQTKTYAFRVDMEYCRDYVAKWEAKSYVKLKPQRLAWTPYIMGRGVSNHFELGPISTIAPRDDDEAKVVQGPDSVGAKSNLAINGVKALPSLEDVDPVTEAEQMSAKSETESMLKRVEEDKENTSPSAIDGGDLDDEEDEEDEADEEDQEEEDWRVAYEGIMPSQFEIFPPASGSRRADRSRHSVVRPSLPRAPSSTSRPRPKRPGGSARRPTASRPKASSSRRKSGGTGRGPGRWPKGTKKSDYGNADSGPGFPPGWLEKHGGDAKAAALAAAKLAAEGKMPDQDEVEVFVQLANTNGHDNPEAGDGTA